jgi:SOS response associated peptidase (SRAP)
VHEGPRCGCVAGAKATNDELLHPVGPVHGGSIAHTTTPVGSRAARRPTHSGGDLPSVRLAVRPLCRARRRTTPTSGWSPGAASKKSTARLGSHRNHNLTATLCSGPRPPYVQGMCGCYMLTSPVEALRQLFMFEQRPNLMRATTSHRPRRADRAPDARWVGARADHGALGPGAVLGGRSLDRQWLINARCEIVHTLRAFREAYSRRRCLVPADGFFRMAEAG